MSCKLSPPWLTATCAARCVAAWVTHAAHARVAQIALRGCTFIRSPHSLHDPHGVYMRVQCHSKALESLGGMKGKEVSEVSRESAKVQARSASASRIDAQRASSPRSPHTPQGACICLYRVSRFLKASAMRQVRRTVRHVTQRLTCQWVSRLRLRVCNAALAGVR